MSAAATGEIAGPSNRPGRPRRVARKLAPLLFVLGLTGAAVITIRSYTIPSSSSRTGASSFSHAYPPDPVPVERPKVSGPPPAVPVANVLHGAGEIRSLAALDHLLPKGALLKESNDRWRLLEPAAIDHGSTLDLQGPATLEIGPQAFLTASNGGVVSLEGMTVTGVAGDGQPLVGFAPQRGFLLALDGGRLWLQQDTIAHLGYLSVLSYGISLREPGPGSGVVDCTIQDDFIGVYTTHAVGVQILRNSVLGSLVYGIDPHTESMNLTIQGNRVVDSGVHGIILADRVTNTTVAGNTVDGSKVHGIVLFDHSDDNVIQGNHVDGAFDGIVVMDSSGNRISGNEVTRVVRFGLRMSGLSNSNTVILNGFSGGLVGIYVYAGPTANLLQDNSFQREPEFVRIRADAPGNRVTPVPPRSELTP